MPGENRDRFFNQQRTENSVRAQLASQERRLRNPALRKRSMRKILPGLIETGRKFVGKPVIAGGKKGLVDRVDCITGALVVVIAGRERKFSQTEIELA